MKALKTQWKNKEFAKCYLFFGTEMYLIKEYEAALMKAILAEGAELMNHDILSERNATAAAIMDAAETFPFLNEKRLVTVRNSDLFHKAGRKEEAERLKAFLADLPETTCLLFIEEKVEKTNGLYKAVVKHGQAVEFKKPTEKDLTIWVRKKGREYGILLSDAVAGLFLQTVENSMENIDSELRKLAAYKGEEKEVAPADIRAVCTASLEAKVFDLVRAVAEKKPEKALMLYRNLLSVKESPYMVLSLITRQFRLILQTLLFSLNGLHNDAIADKLEIRDFAVREYQRQSKRFPAAGWKQALRDCLETDLAIKTGKMAEETAVELLLMKYSTLEWKNTK